MVVIYPYEVEETPLLLILYFSALQAFTLPPKYLHLIQNLCIFIIYLNTSTNFNYLTLYGYIQVTTLYTIICSISILPTKLRYIRIYNGQCSLCLVSLPPAPTTKTLPPSLTCYLCTTIQLNLLKQY